MLMLQIAVAATIAAPPSSRVSVRDAESLSVTVTGAGTTLVLIPGLAGSAFAFRHLAPLLVGGGHRVVIVEPLGMGTSDRPEQADYGLEAQAGRIGAVLDTFGLGGVVIVGHALGASIALRLALARPELVKGVIVIEGGGAERAATPGLRRAMQFAPWIKLFGGEKLVRKELRKSLAKSSADPAWITDEVLSGYTRGMADNLDLTLKAYLRMVAAKDQLQLGPRLGLLRAPVLLILGAAPHDGGPSAKEVETLANGLPSFVVQSVAQAGHHIQEERPAELADLILQFSRSSSPGLASPGR